MKRNPADTFDRPWLLLCEGAADRQFFYRLINQNSIAPDQFQVHYPKKHDTDSGGRGKFGSWLSTMYEVSQSFRENVKALLIVSDNDDDPDSSFKEVQDNLRKASFGVPKQERSVVRKENYPAVVVLMIPMNEVGNLETLCVKAAYNKWDIKEPLDNYVQSVPASKWQLGKLSKMRMQAILAATCEATPDTTLANHWHEKEEYHIPIGDPTFDEILDFLRSFDALLAENKD